MSLIDPVIEDPKVNKDASIQEAPVEDKPEDELLKWAEAKGFGSHTDRKFLEAYRNLEQDHGRLRNEVGESRALMDRVLQLEEERRATAAPKEDEKITLDPTDLLSDPVAALDAYFEKRERKIRQDYDSRIQQLEGQLGQTSLSQKHADAPQLVNDPNFLAFVQNSPTRMLVAQQAVQRGDVNALDALLTEYKASGNQSTGKSQQATDPGEAGRKAARAASLESSASSGGTSSGKIYSRAALIRMKIQDPEAYADPVFQDEIKRAYIEKRVR